MSTPQRFVIRHLTGSKANQVEEFPFATFDALTVGRGGNTDVVYDADHDELVSREHVKLVKDGDDTYSITDLGSRNGTFVNKVQVAGTASIRPGDTVQLGQDGPEFVFDAEPRPARETVIASPRGSKATTLSPSLASATDRAPAKSGVGRETVQRIVTENQREAQKKSTGLLLGVSAGVIALVAALFFFLRPEPVDPGESSRTARAVVDSIAAANPANMTPAEIAQEHSKAAVYIESSWRLIDANNDKSILHQTGVFPVNGQPQQLATYVRLPNGQIEPWLTYADPDGTNLPIRGAGTGSGFVISSDGFIMTNKHVVAGWDYPYAFPQGSFPGAMFTIDANGGLVPQTDAAGNVVRDASGQPVPQMQILQESDMPLWIPSRTELTEETGIENNASLKGVPEIQVTFENSSIPFEAELERISPRADAATIKIDAQEPLHALEMADTYESTAVGDDIVVLGYPGVSGMDVVTVENREQMGTDSRARVVPRVTVTPANVSSIIRSRQTDNPNERLISLGLQDSYQLSTSATGSGNSGGPVFDHDGRVIGIFTYGTQAAGAAVSHAIPIRYGIELTRATGDL